MRSSMLSVTTLAAVLRIYCGWIWVEAGSPVLGGFFSNPGIDQREQWSHEKYIGSRYILKEEPTGFADLMDCGVREGRRELPRVTARF